ncbi:MAG: hypothetical protein CSB23_03780 [Deltaproteobacteria bacterium]|nr:MAG: hypothetical protein CSB23_03780 [Deltaproteobacteria bacterium]
MQKIIDELRQAILLKEHTEIGDTILILSRPDNAPGPQLVYAHVDDIERDTSRRDEWWHLHISILAMPLQKTILTLRSEQMSGKEIFTIRGEEHFIQAIDFAGNSPKKERVQTRKKPTGSRLKRVK